LKLGIKLVLVVALPAIIACLSLGIYSAAQQTRALQEAFERRGETLARTLSEQLGPSLANGDDIDKALTSTLDPLWEEEGLLSVEVLNAAGKEIASRVYSNNAELQPFVCKRPLLAPALPGESVRDLIGLIVVSVDAGPVQKQQEAAYAASLSVALGIGLLASLIAGIFGQLITGPLRSLSAASQQISLGKYDIMVKAQGRMSSLSWLNHSIKCHAPSERETPHCAAAETPSSNKPMSSLSSPIAYRKR
jgi:HAMP domain-containing protein